MELEHFTNNTGIPLSMAIWLAVDEYDYINLDNYVSATELLDSPRQIILGRRAGATIKEKSTADIAEFMARALGTAVHDSIEKAWVKHYKTGMRKLGYPEQIISRMLVNPEPEDIQPDSICIFLEKRLYRKIGKYTIGGKPDFIGDGSLEDFKTTGVYSYLSGSNDWKYMMQGSIYRWLDPELIVNDHMKIQFVFTDWSTADSYSQANKGYPATRIFEKKYLMMSAAETELWLEQRLNLLESLEDAPETDLPRCSQAELWQDAPKYKYFKKPENAVAGKRSTRTLDTMAEAQIKHLEDGSVGKIVVAPGKITRCNPKYCGGYFLCSHKDRYREQGLLK